MTKAKTRYEILSTKDVPKAGKRANEYAENNFEYKLVQMYKEFRKIASSFFINRCVSKSDTLPPYFDRHHSNTRSPLLTLVPVVSSLLLASQSYACGVQLNIKKKTSH